MWFWLRRNPQSRPKDVMVHFGIDKPSASHCLRRLVWKGSATSTGKTHAIKYVATEVRPEDMRGTALNTLRVLQKYTAARTISGCRVNKHH